MQFCTYITIYKGNKLPPFYIGYSTIDKIKKGYNGTVTSKKYSSIWKKERKISKHLFITKIIKIFISREEALLHEEYIQKYFNVHRNPMFINLHISNKHFYNDNNRDTNKLNKIVRTDEWRKKQSESHKGYKHSDISKEKMSQKRKGVSKTEEHKIKIGQGNKGKTQSEETKLLLRNKALGRKHSDETKNKMSQKRKGVPKTEEHKKKLKESQNKRKS